MTESGNRTRPRPVYGPDSRDSFYWDLATSQLRGNQDAAERLHRHATHEAPVRARRAARDRATFEATAPEGTEARINTTPGTGGEFAPPLWLIDRFATAPRAGRILADLCDPLPLPGGVHSINVPRITTGTLAAPQPADGAPLASRDLATDSITAPVCTIGGFLDVSAQLEDQAPAGFDVYAHADLMAAYDADLEGQALTGTGANGQLLGLANVPGAVIIDGTGATAVETLWPLLGKVAAQSSNARKLPPEFWLWAPRRWFWATGQVDTAKRPIPTDPPLGIPYRLDGAITAGPAADNIYTCRPSDMFLWESAPKAMVTAEPVSGTLEVRITYAKFVAWLPHRYPSGIGVITGVPAPSDY